MADNKNMHPDPLVNPETRSRLLKSMMSTPKKQAIKERQQQAVEPSTDEQTYFPGEKIPVEYQDDSNYPSAPEGFMNPHVMKQMQNWEKNYVPNEEVEEEPENPEENEEDEIA